MPQPPIFIQARRQQCTIPSGEDAIVKVPPPGSKISEPDFDLTTLLLPAGFTIIGFIIMIVVATTSNSSAIGLTMAISVPMMLGSYVVTIMRHSKSKSKYNEDVKLRDTRYQETLDNREKDVADLHTVIKECMLLRDPDPEKCFNIIKGRDPSCMWARLPSHPDFLNLRLGIGTIPSHIEIEVPDYSTGTEHDPLIEKARELKQKYMFLSDVPVGIHLKRAGIAGICGDRDSILKAVRSLVIQIATHHSPADVKLVAIYPSDEAASWDWMRWLPHTWSDEKDIRYMTCEKESAHQILDELNNILIQRQFTQSQKNQLLQSVSPTPEYVFIFAAPGLIEGEAIVPLLLDQANKLCAYPLILAGSTNVLHSSCKITVDIKATSGTVDDETGTVKHTYVYNKPDEVTIEFADQFSRTLAPIVMKSGYKESPVPSLVTLFDILNIDRIDTIPIPDSRRGKKDPTVSLAVPVGRRAGNKLQMLDLQNSKKGSGVDSFHGPHGLIAGATGAGKGELLRSYIAAIATYFDPHEVVLVLLDFMTPGLVDNITPVLPHVINTITNLEIQRVPRALQSLKYEMERRELLFLEASNKTGELVDDLEIYMDLYHQNEVNIPLPYVIFLVDEFTALKNALPESMDEFVEYATKGRKVGFRMILATQKPEGVIAGQIASNTNLRLCLRVSSPEDSRAVVYDSDAAYFRGAGRTKLHAGSDVSVIFQSALTKAPYDSGKASNHPNEIIATVHRDGKREPLNAPPKTKDDIEEKSQFRVLIQHIAEQAKQQGIEKFPPIWLEPLEETIAINLISPQLAWDGTSWKDTGRWLQPTIGFLDDPANQRQSPAAINLAEYGHLFICYGSPDNARLTLRTITEQLARDHSPDDVNFYFLDFGNSGLSIFESLPHTGAVIRQYEEKRIMRLFNWLTQEMENRRKWFADHGYATLAESRAKSQTDIKLPALVIVLDNLSSLKDKYDLVGGTITQLISQGGDVGIHFIIAGNIDAAKTMTKPLTGVKLSIGLELDSKDDYKAILGDYPKNLYLPANVVGRGLYKDPSGSFECQIATGSDNNELISLADQMQMAAQQACIRQPYTIANLPNFIELYALLPIRAPDSWRSYSPSDAITAPLGLADSLPDAIWWPSSPIRNNPTSQPFSAYDINLASPLHYLLVGPEGGGKTSVMRTWLLALAEKYPVEAVQFLLMDTIPDCSLAVLQRLPHVKFYGVTEEHYRDILSYLKSILDKREEEQDQLCEPLIVVAIDNYPSLHQRHESICTMMKDLIQKSGSWNVRFLVSGHSTQIPKSDLFFRELKKSEAGILVGSQDISNDQGFYSANANVIVPHPQNKEKLLPGRGYFIQAQHPHLIQVASPGDDQDVVNRVNHLVDVNQSFTHSYENHHKKM